MNIVDAVIMLLVAVTVIRGAEIGLVRQIGSLLGLVTGVVVGSFLASITNAGALVSLLLIALAVVAAVAAGEYGGIRLKQILHNFRLHKLDGFLGAGVGAIICLLLVWFGASVIVAVPSPGIQTNVRDSRIITWLDASLPPATSLMRWLEDSLAQTKLPDIVRELEPNLPRSDAPLPDVGLFNDVVARARASVVEIEGRSCNGIGVGSGFVAGNGIVVTNAHVVAGMRNPYVHDDNGRHRSEIIGFDPDLDIAVLRTNGLAGKPLSILDSLVENGTPGVVLGYPGGGPFAVRPAVITERFIALGQDIYNEVSGRRDVYALKADIEQGNSGGPLLDAEGRVIGVIFARSTSYENTGYALTTPAVLNVLRAAQQNPSNFGSTRCVAS